MINLAEYIYSNANTDKTALPLSALGIVVKIIMLVNEVFHPLWTNLPNLKLF